MIDFKKKNYLQLLFILSFIVLATAYFIEFILGYQPCNLCIIERVPYGLAIIILILNYKFKKDQIFYSILLLLVFAFSILISLYHFSIEQNFIDESVACAAKNIDLITKEDILNSMQELQISCKDVAFRVFGLSLTTYNIVISLFMFFITIKVYLINNDIKK